jgi:hypothetical protein
VRLLVPFLGETVLYFVNNIAGILILGIGTGLEGMTLAEAPVTMGCIGIGILVPAGPGFFGAFQLSTYMALAMFFPEDTLRVRRCVRVPALYSRSLAPRRLGDRVVHRQGRGRRAPLRIPPCGAGLRRRAMRRAAKVLCLAMALAFAVQAAFPEAPPRPARLRLLHLRADVRLRAPVDRVDLGCTITEKDVENGYLLFNNEPEAVFACIMVRLRWCEASRARIPVQLPRCLSIMSR